MAKKKSRNTRKQSSTKRRQDVPKKLVEQQQPLPVAPVIPEEPTTVKPTVAKKEVAPSLKSESDTNDFAQDYFYIYSELRNILIITVIMFATLAGMSFMI